MFINFDKEDLDNNPEFFNDSCLSSFSTINNCFNNFIVIVVLSV